MIYNHRNDVKYFKALVSEEAYFGIENPFTQTVKSYIAELRRIYDTSTKMTKISFTSQMQKVAAVLGEQIARNINAEECSVGLFNEVNAFCIPMCWDDYASLGKERQNHINSLEDIVEYKTGYRFRTPERKRVILGLGLGLFPIMTDDEITAIVFHELGHTFQHMLVGVNGAITWGRLSQTIRDNLISLNVFVLLLSFGLSIFGFDGDKVKVYKKDIKEDTQHEAYSKNQKLLDRKDAAESLNKSSKRSIATVYGENQDKENQGPVGKFFIWIFDGFFGIFTGIFSLIILILYPLFKLVNVFEGIYEFSNVSWLKKNRSFEQFADHFAASYGLGVPLAKALSILGKDRGVDIQSLSFLNYVPGLNLWLAWSAHLQDSTTSLRQGYPSTGGRHATVYSTLEFELAHNETLTSAQKDEIKKQMADIEQIYQEYIARPGSKNFVFKVISGTLNKSLKDEKSDIQENVLIVLKEKREDLAKLRKEDKELDERLKVLEEKPYAALSAIKLKKAKQ